MTSFGEYVRFSPECLTKFHSLPVCEVKNNFLINTARNSISSIEAHSRKIVRSWTLTHPHSFTSPACYCPSDDTISCIIDGKELMIWPRTSDDLNTGSKTNLKKPAFAVISSDEFATFVVFNDGDILTIEDVTSNPDSYDVTADNDHDSKELIWADIVNKSENVYVAALVSRQKKIYTLQSFLLKKGKCTSLIQKVPIENEEQTLKSWSLHCGPSFPSLLTIWNTGQVVSFCLKNGMKHMLFSVCDVAQNSSIVMDVVEKSHLVIAKASIKTVHTVLELWDIKYAVKKCSKLIKEPLAKNVQIKSISSNVFLSSQEGIEKVPLSLESSSLATVIGKSASTDLTSTKPESYEWSLDGEFMSMNGNHEEEMDTSVSSSTEMNCDRWKELMPKKLDEEEKQYFEDLHKLKDIPEEGIVKMLKISLRYQEKQGDCNNSILNRIFQVPFTDKFLKPQLAKLSFPEALASLRYLRQLFDSSTVSLGDREGPSDLQIAQWVQLLIHSYCEEIVVTKDHIVLDLVQTLRQAVIEKIQVYSEMGEIDCLLKLIRKKDLLPEKCANDKYGMEILYL